MNFVENLPCSPEGLDKSLKFLSDVLNNVNVPNLITFQCFVMPTEINSEIQFDWECSVSISKDEFHAQIYYDLAIYNFYKESYGIAKTYFLNTLQCLEAITECKGFSTVKSDALEGFLIACNAKAGYKYNLTKQLKISILNQFMVGFIGIFEN